MPNLPPAGRVVGGLGLSAFLQRSLPVDRLGSVVLGTACHPRRAGHRVRRRNAESRNLKRGTAVLAKPLAQRPNRLSPAVRRSKPRASLARVESRPVEPRQRAPGFRPAMRQEPRSALVARSRSRRHRCRALCQGPGSFLHGERYPGAAADTGRFRCIRSREPGALPRRFLQIDACDPGRDRGGVRQGSAHFVGSRTCARRMPITSPRCFAPGPRCC